MEIEIISLDKIPFRKLVLCFNAAFSDYVVKFTITEDALRERWENTGVDYSLSYGAMVAGELVGFIVHGINEKDGVLTAYNAGTGVLPAYRGFKITRNIYRYALRLLKAKGIKQSILEVIQENEPALHIYESVGFQITREVSCFSGSFTDHNRKEWHPDLELKRLNADWDKLRTFWDFKPDWEGEPASIRQTGERLMIIGLYDKGALCGYTAFNPESGKVRQFAVSKENRRKGYGRLLFGQVAEVCPRLTINNIDSDATGTIAFLETIGMKNHINQYEMKLALE